MIVKYSANLILFLLLIPLGGCTTLDKFGSEGEIDVEHISIDSDTFPVVILGGGIGGLTASIYLAQAGLEPLVVQGDLPGGVITQSNCVENWPGEMAISGIELVQKIRAQALKCGALIVNKKISSVDFSHQPYKIKMCDVCDEKQTSEIKTLSCIIVMGSKPNMLNVIGESGPEGYLGRGVSVCAICDGALYKDKIVAVVGGGNSAMAESLYLSSLAKKVYVIVRSDKLKASIHEQELVLKKPNIEILLNTKVAQILGDGSKLTSLILENTKDVKSVRKLAVDGLFLAIGSKPNTQLFENQLTLDENGFIQKFDCQETSKPGIYTAGDISDNRFRQAITAAGDAAKAALQTIKFLQKLGYSHKKRTLNKQITDKQVPNKFPHNTKISEVKNSKQFKDIVTNSKDKLVVVDFYGTYCIPCKNMAPIFEKLAQNYEDNATFVRVDVSINTDLAHQFRIQSIPTFLFLKNGKIVKKIEGSRSYEFLEKLLNE